MNEENFWGLIEYSKDLSVNKEEQLNLLVEIFSERSILEVAEFDSFIFFFLNKSYTSQLWAIAYYLNNGCSDDSFEYYRGWLISEGEKKFTILTGNPELIVKYFSKKEINGFSEKFISLGYEVIEKNDPDNFDKQDELEQVTDQVYKDKFDARIKPIELNWETVQDIEKLYPVFAEKFK